jgi:hypothetical protein
LTNATTTFSWNAGSDVTSYGLWVGSAAATYDLYAVPVSGLSQALTLPTDGRTLYVRLWSLINGAWQYNDYSYTADPTTYTVATVPVNAQMLSPAAGTTLTGPTTTFTWNSGSGVTQYAIWGDLGRKHCGSE